MVQHIFRDLRALYCLFAIFELRRHPCTAMHLRLCSFSAQHSTGHGLTLLRFRVAQLCSGEGGLSFPSLLALHSHSLATRTTLAQLWTFFNCIALHSKKFLLPRPLSRSAEHHAASEP